MTKPVVLVPRALALDVCPNARRCQHHPRSTIGAGGSCPDCGRQVWPAGAPLAGGSSNRAAILFTQMSYHGGYEE